MLVGFRKPFDCHSQHASGHCPAEHDQQRPLRGGGEGVVRQPGGSQILPPHHLLLDVSRRSGKDDNNMSCVLP